MSWENTRHRYLIAADGFELEAWQPLCDICQTPDGWLVRMDLSGIRQEDISLSRTGRRLRIQGTRRDEMASEEFVYHRMEIEYRKFERQLEMPCCVETAEVDCEYRDGLFLIWLTKKGE